MKHIPWILAVVLVSFGTIYAVAVYEIEAAKQEAFMMKACVDAGGDWQRTWRNVPTCTRPIQK